ncbi:type IV toxin-antitoxin system AbiEi family antitoxin domain-containing protein [bacterium]|jgi:predicted transcriptional regulator of viral defense system|nr:type IV toxin-antitoxin system AbiEi family antitoxin domain-containing protein [bacterium]
MAQDDTPNFRQKGRRLSPVLSKIILQAEEDNQQILTTKALVDYYKITDSYARKMIANLVENGWLVRVGPGKYQLQPAKTGLDPYPSADKFVAAGQLSADGFIAFGSAAEYHGLTTQVFQSVTVATTKRSRIREGAPVRIEYIHVNLDNFVGYQNISKAPNVRIANVERTLLDVIDRPDYSGGISDIPEIFRRATSRAKVDKILEYLPTYHSKSLVQRIGFMLEAFGYQLTPEHVQEMQKMSKGNYAYLFTAGRPGTDSHSRYNSKWRLVVNAPGFAPEEKAG